MSSLGHELALKRTDVDWWTAVSLGKIPGFMMAVAQGTNTDVDTASVPEDLIPAGGTYSWPTVAAQLEIVSSSVNDAAAGTGARTVLVTGLNASLAVISETVTMNGLTPVTTVNSYLRVNSLNAITVGALGYNDGEIVIRALAAGPRRFTIPATFGRGQSCIFTVPAGFNGWLLDGFFSQLEATGAQASCGFQLWSRELNQSWRNRLFVTTSQGNPTQVLAPRTVLPMGPGCDFRVSAQFAGVNNIYATATVSILLTAVGI